MVSLAPGPRHGASCRSGALGEGLDRRDPRAEAEPEIEVQRDLEEHGVTMAVMLRLKRCGRRHRPFYRVEAIEKRNARQGKSLEIVGTYDPFIEDPLTRVKLKVDRVQYWIDQGARPSETVTSFLRKVDVKYGKVKTSRRAAQRAKKREAEKK